MDFFQNEITKKYLLDRKIIVADAGALGGAQSRWNKIAPDVLFVGFEPQDDLTTEFNIDKGGISNVALSSRPGSATLYMTRKEDGSSLLVPDQDSINRFATVDRYEVIGSKDIIIDTLDNQIEKHKIQCVDFLKIDTQGTELDILKGSEKLLGSSVFGIEVECNFIPRYKGQCYFSDIDFFLRDKGFELIDFSRRFMSRKGGLGRHQIKGQMTHGTALYLRTQKSAEKMINSLENKKRAAAIIRFSSIACIYGYIDIAEEIIESFKNNFNHTEFESLKKFFLLAKKKHLLSGKPVFPRIRNILSRLLKYMESIDKRDQVGDSHIGNT